MTSIAIHQPNFLPYLGFVDKALKSDIFVIYDDAQFSKGDWHNRNKIRTSEGWTWLSVPVKRTSGNIAINKVEIDNNTHWKKKHVMSLRSNYSRSHYYSQYKEKLESIFSEEYNYLIDLNMKIIKFYWESFSIGTELLLSSSLNIESKGTTKLIDISKRLGADTYISGSGAGSYLDTEAFSKEGINIELQEFKSSKYTQIFQGFEENMAAIDYLFNMGPVIK